jgi:hypothetical protein
MTDTFPIGAALNGIKAAIDIAKAIRNSDISIEKAEMKFKIAELLEALADAKIYLADVKDIIEKKDSEISELKKAFEIKEKLIRKGNYYVLESDPEGNVNKYCLACWDHDRKLVSLLLGQGTIHCNICIARKK